MTKIRQFIFIILILCPAVFLHSCGQMIAEDEGLDSKSIEEASGSTGTTTDDTITDDTTTDNTTVSTFVAVGSQAVALTSSDGISWTSNATGLGTWIHGVTYANSTFLAAGGSGGILKSSDGTSWTSIIYDAGSGTNYSLRNFTYANSIFVLVGTKMDGSISGTILTSADGTSWTSRTSGTSNDFNGVTSR